METKEKVFNAVEIIAIISLFVIIAIPDKEPTHYSTVLQSKMYCDHLSTTKNTCYPYNWTRRGSKYSSSGWEEIPFIIPEVQDYRLSKGDWICPKRPNPCYKKQNEFIPT